jgi:hypothetical protein
MARRGIARVGRIFLSAFADRGALHFNLIL